MQQRLTSPGSTLRPAPSPRRARSPRAVREHVWPLLESGAVKPLIYTTFPLRDAAAAHRSWNRARTSARSCSSS
jgi:NADPH2:quinone reductase